jgi:hypothetical protein
MLLLLPEVLVINIDGEILGVNLDGSCRLIVTPSAFVCSSFQPKIIRGGLGLKYGGFGDMVISGSGLLGIKGMGGIVPIDLDTGEVISFDPAFLVARDETVDILPLNGMVTFPGANNVSIVNDFPSLNVNQLWGLFSQGQTHARNLIMHFEPNRLLRNIFNIVPHSIRDVSKLLSSALGLIIKGVDLGYKFWVYVSFHARTRFRYHFLGEKGMYSAKGPGIIYLSLRKRHYLARFQNPDTQ